MTEDGRQLVSLVMTTMADTLPVWRDSAVLILAAFVIGCLLFVAAIAEP